MDFPKHRNRLLQSEFSPSQTERDGRGRGGRERERGGRGREKEASCIGWTAIPAHLPPLTRTQRSSAFTVPGVGCTCNHGGSPPPQRARGGLYSIHSGVFVLQVVSGCVFRAWSHPLAMGGWSPGVPPTESPGWFQVIQAARLSRAEFQEPGPVICLGLVSPPLLLDQRLRQAPAGVSAALRQASSM